MRMGRAVSRESSRDSEMELFRSDRRCKEVRAERPWRLERRLESRLRTLRPVREGGGRGAEEGREGVEPFR